MLGGDVGHRLGLERHGVGGHVVEKSRPAAVYLCVLAIFGIDALRVVGGKLEKTVEVVGGFAELLVAVVYHADEEMGAGVGVVGADGVHFFEHRRHFHQIFALGVDKSHKEVRMRRLRCLFHHLTGKTYALCEAFGVVKLEGLTQVVGLTGCKDCSALAVEQVVDVVL